MSKVDKACHVCTKTSEVSKPYLVCSRCKNAIYCSAECQKTDWPTHKASCKAPPPEAPVAPLPPMQNGKPMNYIIKFQIWPDEIKNPAVWRTLSIPSTITFDILHTALQDAFNWSGTHLYQFFVRRKKEVWDPHLAIEDDLVTNGKCRDFRQVEIMHLDMSKAQQKPYPTKVASKTRLFEIIEDSKWKGKGMTYEYDFGDCWEHVFTFLGTEAGTGRITCKDGGGHYVAEDAGHTPGWNNVLAAYRAQRPTKEQLQKRAWFEKQASNKDPLGLSNGGEHRWDKDAINKALAINCHLNEFANISEMPLIVLRQNFWARV